MEKTETKSSAALRPGTRLKGLLCSKKAPEAVPVPETPPVCEILPFDRKDYHTLSLLLNGFKAAVGEAPLTQLEWAALRIGIEEERITYHIAWKEGRAVGVYSLCRSFSSYRCAAVGIFEDFYVLPEARGTGVARALAEHARSVVRSWGGHTLTVTCAECDREMYRALGFTEAIGTTLSQDI